MQRVRHYLAQGRRSLSAAFILLLFYAVVMQAVFYLRTSAQTPSANASPTPSATPAGKPLAADNPWKDYFEAVSKERELVQNDAKANLGQMERLQDRIFALIVGLGALLLGFIYFLFGQTKEQVQAQLQQKLKDDLAQEIERLRIAAQKDLQQNAETLRQELAHKLETEIAQQVEQELLAARARVREEVEREVKAQFAAEIKKTVGAYIEDHYKTQPIRWVAAAETDTVREVTQALHTLQFTNVQRVTPDKLAELAGARVVLFAYGKLVKSTLTAEEEIGNETALAQLQQVAAWLRQQPAPIPLVIYNQSNTAIDKAEREALHGIAYVASNFTGTLITQTLTLLHR